MQGHGGGWALCSSVPHESAARTFLQRSQISCLHSQQQTGPANSCKFNSNLSVSSARQRLPAGK